MNWHSGLLSLCTVKCLHKVSWCHFPWALRNMDGLLSHCALLYMLQNHVLQASFSPMAHQAPVHLCCRAAKGVWEPNTSKVCSSIQTAYEIMAACRPDCRLVGAVVEENNSFLKTRKIFCSSEFPCFSALYEYSFWIWHVEGSLVSRRLNKKKAKQYFYINCLFAYLPDEWHLWTDRSAAKQNSRDEYAWQHTAPCAPSELEKASGGRSSSVLKNSISFPPLLPEYKKRLTLCHRN